MGISRKLCFQVQCIAVQITEASQNSELKFTYNTVNSVHSFKVPSHCLAQTVIQIQNTQDCVFEIQNTKYVQCILNTYFKYLYFKYFTTLIIMSVGRLSAERVGEWNAGELYDEQQAIVWQ